LDGGVDARLGAVLDAVAAHDRRTHDRLGHRRQQRADLLPDRGIGRRQPPLEVPQAHEQREESQPDHERELPAVDEHDHGRHRDLADAHDRDHTAEDEELRHLVDVAGDPRHQGAAALGVLGEDREVVHVPEGLDPQGGEAVLRGPEQPARHQRRRRPGQHDAERGQRRHQPHEAAVGAAGAVDAAVDRLLHRDRHQHPAGGRDDREEQREPDALGQLRRETHAAAQRRPRGRGLPAEDAGARGGAHRTTLSSPVCRPAGSPGCGSPGCGSPGCAAAAS
jgi:hypothetical protein